MAINSEIKIEDPILEIFRNKLQKRLGSNLKELWLFGSRARGDFRNDSDYDVLVVADGIERNTREIVLEEGYSILDEQQEWIGVIVYSPEHWDRSQNTPLGLNIVRDGKRIA